ncbi:hypothetical protein B296_00017677 [Ensete ventricosum]|uniref:Uncharacterized protein n=1 Tax=Ensete ventricosum TaxID=4639 RepID=A0A426Y6I5_ENSVE|nr:hypothetical protein B296_00017677 [Ensete ventricosum]
MFLLRQVGYRRSKGVILLRAPSGVLLSGIRAVILLPLITEGPQPTLLLPFSSSTVVATVGCHPPLRDHRSPDITAVAAFKLKIAATLFNRFDLTGWRSFRHDIGGLI